jgi:hypothetical protein
MAPALILALQNALVLHARLTAKELHDGSND